MKDLESNGFIKFMYTEAIWRMPDEMNPRLGEACGTGAEGG